MIRVRIITDEAKWCYYRRAHILREYAPDDIAIEVLPFPERFTGEPPSVLMDLNYGHIEEVRMIVGHLSHWKDTILLTAFNHGWKSRYDYFERALENAHFVLCNNKTYWHQAGEKPGTAWIANGVDRRIFKPTVPIADRPRKALWVGSEHHRETKNYNRLLVGLADRLKDDIECDFRLTDPYGPSVMNPQEMADWYNSGSVYICASTTEGTPNPALEAAACGCAVVTTQVGNMPELIKHGVNGRFITTDPSVIDISIKLAMQKREQYSAAMLQDIAGWDWQERAESFYDLFRKLHFGQLPLLRERGTK